MSRDPGGMTFDPQKICLKDIAKGRNKLIRVGVRVDMYPQPMVNAFATRVCDVRINREKLQAAWFWFHSGWDCAAGRLR